jgi:LuxR family transcriptional regulator, maltose regulon positive regulatory protein
MHVSPLISKLNPPLATAFEIARTEICEKIFNAGSAKLVLLRAPAGFGKTTVMLQVRQRFNEAGLPTAWLTLDRADNDIGRFLSVLAAALDPLVPGLAKPPAQEDKDGPEDLAFSLIDRVAAHPAPFALFLDDFEVLQNPAIFGLVNEFIEQLPRGAQLIIGSRGVPELSLGRLRARGRLLEVEHSQLRFSVAETDGFLCQRRGLALGPEDVLRLHRSTEGWAAALWLASVSLEHREQPERFIAGFSGSNAAVVDYLVEDVLSNQSEDLRGFLLRTSILNHLDAALCDAVCARADSADMLHRLEQAHLFLIPLQSEGSGYRYHGMFAEFLRAQLARLHPEEIPRLHHAAAQWFLDQDRPVPAIEHALAAGDMAFALPLLNAQAQSLLDQGRVRLLSRWLDPLQAQGQLDAHPMLQVVHVWAVCFARGPRAAAALLDQLELRADAAAEVRAHRLAMRPLFMVLTDRTDEAMPLAVALLDGLPSSVNFVRGFLEVILANLAMIAGRYREALLFADAARSRQPEHGSSFNFTLSEAAEAAVDLTRGRLRRALARLRVATGTGRTDASRATNGNAMAGVLLAEALFEADQCDQAERLLAVYIPLIRHVGIPDQLILAHVVMARIAQDRGDTDRSLQLLTELEHIGHRDGLPRVVASARLERVRLLLVEGQLVPARDELDRCGDKALWARVSRSSLRANEVETYEVALARWSVQSGHAADVVASLRVELDAAERAQRERRALTLRLLLAQALYCSDQRNKAMRVLAKALRIAAAEGYVRAFMVEGTLLMAMLHELRIRPTEWLEEGGDAPLTFLDGLLRTPAKIVPTAMPNALSMDAAMAVEGLTRKELQVLRLTAEGLSNDQIGERMFVAETTVRTHLRNINVKLDSRNRMEAVQVARRLGWLA